MFEGGRELIIYLDVLIIQNFIVNLFLLYITAQTLRIKPKLNFICISALIGTVYAVLAVYSNSRYLFNITLKIIVATAMVLIVFKKNNFIFIVKATIVFVLYSMLLAGLCIFIELNSSTNIDFTFNKISYKVLLSSVMIIYVIIHRLIAYIRDRNELTRFIYDVEIVMDSGVKKVKAFFDTGNELREPATNLPVMIIEKDMLSNIDFSKESIYLIPYKVVNGFSSKMEGFKPKYIKVYDNNKSYERQVIVAFCENQLSSLNEYNALLSRGIL